MLMETADINKENRVHKRERKNYAIYVQRTAFIKVNIVRIERVTSGIDLTNPSFIAVCNYVGEAAFLGPNQKVENPVTRAS